MYITLYNVMVKEDTLILFDIIYRSQKKNNYI